MSGLFCGGASIAQITFVAAGAGTATAGTAIAPAYPAGIGAGQYLLLHVHVIDSGASPAVSTPSGWTLLSSTTTGSGPTTLGLMYGKIADGTESGTLSVSVTQGVTQRAARMYSFTGGSTVYANGSGVVAGSSTTITGAAMATTGSLELIFLCFSGAANTTIGDCTGETGGIDYTEAVAEFSTATGGNLTMQLQTAIASSPVTVTGGTATFGAAATNRFTHYGVIQNT